MIAKYKRIHREGYVAAFVYEKCPYILFSLSWWVWQCGNEKGVARHWEIIRKRIGEIL